MPSHEPIQRAEPYDSLDFKKFERRSPWLYVFLLALFLGAGAGVYLLLASDATDGAAVADDATVATGDQVTDASATPTDVKPALDADSKRVPAAQDAGKLLPQDAGKLLRQDAGKLLPQDAGRSTSAGAAPARAPWSYRWKDDGRAYTAIVSPGHVMPGKSVQIEIKMESPTAIESDAIATLSFSHYRDHGSAAPVRSLRGSSGSFVFQKTLPKPGKYHATLRIIEGKGRRARTRFDICIGADPAVSSQELSTTCPEMNKKRPARNGH